MQGKEEKPTVGATFKQDCGVEKLTVGLLKRDLMQSTCQQSGLSRPRVSLR